MSTSTVVGSGISSAAAIVGSPPTPVRSAGDGHATPDSFARALNQASTLRPGAAAASPGDATAAAPAAREGAAQQPATSDASALAAARAAPHRKTVAAAAESAAVTDRGGARTDAATAASTPAEPALNTPMADDGAAPDAPGHDSPGLAVAWWTNAVLSSDRGRGKFTPPGNRLGGATSELPTNASLAQCVLVPAGTGTLPAAGSGDATVGGPAHPLAAPSPLAMAVAPPAALLAGAVSSASAAFSAATEGRLPASPGSADFAPALGAQLSVFLREGVHHARLQLHPAELGPLTVQIQLDGNSAQVRLAAEHPLTRQALEQAMPTLAGVLRESGLTLTGGGVFEQPANPQQQGDRAAAGSGDPGTAGRTHGDGREPADDAAAAALRAPPVRRGVVDLVA